MQQDRLLLHIGRVERKGLAKRQGVSSDLGLLNNSLAFLDQVIPMISSQQGRLSVLRWRTAPTLQMNQPEATLPPGSSRGGSLASLLACPLPSQDRAMSGQNLLPSTFLRGVRQLYRKEGWRAERHNEPLPCSHTTLHAQCHHCSASVQRLRDRTKDVVTLKDYNRQSGGPPEILVLRLTAEAGSLASDDAVSSSSSSSKELLARSFPFAFKWGRGTR